MHGSLLYVKIPHCGGIFGLYHFLKSIEGFSKLDAVLYFNGILVVKLYFLLEDNNIVTTEKQRIFDPIFKLQMQEKLTVRNFGPIKDANLDIKRFMVFIGPQSSGKSTIAKLLAIFRNIELVREGSSDSVPIRYFKDFNMQNYFQNGNTYLEYSCPNYKIILNDKYLLEFVDKKWQVILSPEFETKLKNEEERVKTWLLTLIETNRLNQDKGEDKGKLLQRLYDLNWKSLFTISKSQVYVPAERILLSLVSDFPFTLKDSALPNSFEDFGRHFEQAKSRIETFNIGFLNLTYKYEEGKGSGSNRIYYNFDEEKSISLSESSSGVQAIVPLLIVVENIANETSGGSAFIIEEPELNLFPTTQKDVVQFLINKCNTNSENEAIITTHSPYILSALNNLLFAFSVGKKSTKHAERATLVLNKQSWINPSEFNAYYAFDGCFKQIFDQQNEMISENELDDVSMQIAGVYDELMEIYRQDL